MTSSWSTTRDESTSKVTAEMLDAEPYVALVTHDGVLFMEPWRVLQCSAHLTLKRVVSVKQSDIQELQLQACSKTLKPILQFCRRFEAEPMSPLTVMLIMQVQPWYQEYSLQFSGDMLIEMIKTAQYLKIDALVSLLMAKATYDLCKSSPDGMPSIQELQNFKNRCATGQ
jgi:hypothetical protein